MLKSFAELFRRVEDNPGYHAERMAVAFLAELNARMKARGMSNSDLARAAGVSPAYITKLFRGPSNVSLETIAKLAIAVGCRPHLHLAAAGAEVRWLDVMQQREHRAARPRPAPAFNSMMQALEKTEPLSTAKACNDRQFAADLQFA